MTFLILFLSIIKIITSQKESKVLFVFEHCRHGARGMKDLFEDKDILNEMWIGKEELSSVGLRQHYLLGVLMRKKYKELLDWNNLNNLKDIFVYSTPSNRTIMSARAQLFGMFNYNNNSNLSENQIQKATPYYLKNNLIIKELINNLSYSVLPNNIPSEIPIHIIEREENLFQFEKDEKCEGIKKQRKQNEKKSIVKNSIEEFNKLFITDELKKYLNCKNDSEKDFTNLKNIQKLALSYIINKVDGRNLDEFEKLLKNKTLFYEKCMNILEIKSLEIQSGDKENLIAYASSSVLLRFILNLIDKVVENDKLNKTKNNVPKFFLLSGHDTTLVMAADLLKVLFKSNKKFPSFATSQIFELIKSNNEYYINLIFNNETTIQKNIKYGEFKQIIEEKCWSLEQTGIFCGFIKKTFNGWKTLTFIFAILCFIVICFFIVKCFLKKYEHTIEL